MASGLVLTVAQTLFAALQCQEVRELCSTFVGYKSKLDDLQRTVTTIKAVLLDAETKHQELTNEGHVWFEELKDAVYDADDFFDELTTISQLKKLPEKKISKKVRRFFSRENQLVSAFNTSRKIKKLREKLDGIADDHRKFGFSGEYKPIKRSEETCSYVYEPDIIGREADKENIVGMLLSSSNSIVSYVNIVGMGGLGKTALAQLVYNDMRIKEAFGDDLYWICVSMEFGLEKILSKFPGIKNQGTLQDLHEEVRRKVGGKKYLLVLDDVWEENHYEWLTLKGLFHSGGAGSKILVTSRSRKVGLAIDKDVAVYKLEGLSIENSWHLFKLVALGQAEDPNDIDLKEIGKDIVKKCTNVPLSIKVTGSLLYGLDKSRWEAFRSMNLANMSRYYEKDPIMSTLMFSYHNLTHELKSCFSFCSIFPKDYTIKKEVLISLWLAQGYLVPIHEGESMEDVGVDYFCVLLQRCFFQDVERDEFGEIHSCKMHDLMHDLALKVVGKESLMLTTCTTHNLENKLRHLSAYDAPIDVLFSKGCPTRETLRTLVKLDRYSSMNVNVATIVSNCRRLRVLHLRGYDMTSVHEELGKLLHLRYLDLSYSNSLNVLHKSITMLHNLKILKLWECKALIELPKDMKKLVNLRMLDMHGCSQLEELPKDIGKLVNLEIMDIRGCSTLKELPEGIVKLLNLRTLNIYKSSYICNINYMPPGIDNLKNLHTLTYFVVGGESSTQFHKGELVDLKGLSLRGQLCIKVGRLSPSNMSIPTKGADILTKACLKDLKIHCAYENYDFIGPFDQGEHHEALLEGLNPNNDLSTLVMIRYEGTKFPKWGSGKVNFPARIVRLELNYCVGLKHLSSVSKLVCLKYLNLSGMMNLEYIECDAPCDVSNTFFPSLEELLIKEAFNLKGMWRDITWKENGGSGCLVDTNDDNLEVLPSFTRLRHLEIQSCISLKYFPPCPHLKKLQLCGVNEALSFHMKSSTHFTPTLATTTIPSTSVSSNLWFQDPILFNLEKLAIRGSNILNSLFRESFLGCVDIEISWFFPEKRLWEIREGFKRCSLSLQHLSIRDGMFQTLSHGVLEYLMNLRSLKIERCYNLHSLGTDKNGMPWKSLGSLTSLELSDLPRLAKFPMGLRHLTSLRSLKVERLKLEVEGIPWKSLKRLSSLELIKLSKLVNLPQDFQYLQSLQSILIVSCDNLEDLGEFVSSLTSLQSLHIKSCSQLKSLPEAMCHLTTLTQLEIRYPSKELKERCQEPDGEDFLKIRHIHNKILW